MHKIFKQKTNSDILDILIQLYKFCYKLILLYERMVNTLYESVAFNSA